MTKLEVENIGSAAPLPYSTRDVGTQTYVLDANGRKIASIFGRAPERTHTANLLVEAVNAVHRGDGRVDASIEEIGAALAGVGLR